MGGKSGPVSVAICTWNRARLLEQTLEQMARLECPKGVEWEVLVVDNNCADDTAEVVRRFECLLPIRRVLEEQQGLSHARNRAIDEARGDVIIWTDDDVLVDENWLVEYVAGFERHPGAAFFGGPIDPWFEKAPADWLSREFGLFASAYACRNLGHEEFVIESIQKAPYGANMAVRKGCYEVVRYDSNLGRRGKGMVSGEETKLFEAILAADLKGVWLPSVHVRHFIPIERLNRGYLRRYYQGEGIMMVRMGKVHSEGAIKVLGVPGWVLRGMLAACCKAALSRIARAAHREGMWVHFWKEFGKVKEFLVGKAAVAER